MTETPERFKLSLLASKPARQGRGGAAAMATSVFVHAAIVGLLIYATMAVAEDATDEEDVVTIIDVVDTEIPPPPPPPPAAEPPPPMADVPRGFQVLSTPTIIPPDIPPPGEEISEQDFSGEGVEGGRAGGEAGPPSPDAAILAGPVFTPYSEAPRLRNRDEIVRELQRRYPPLLKRSGTSGTVLMWVLVDESGNVIKNQVQKTSGYPAMDDVANQVAQQMKFTPGMNRDVAVKVWLAIPIQFTATS
jgi:protein TonB